MVKSVANFNLCPFEGSPYAGGLSRIRELTNTLAVKYNLTVEPGEFLTIDMDSPVFPSLVAELVPLQRDRLVFPGHGFIRTQWVDSAADPAAWFQYEPKGELRHIITGTASKLDMLSCVADAARPGKHLGGSTLGIYGSEEFKALVERQKFTGLEFVWVEDKGRYNAPQWYFLNLVQALGRGLDHEWFDARKWTPHPSEASPEWRCGKTWFDKSELKNASPFSSAAKDCFVSLCPDAGTRELRFRTYRQYVKRFLPNTDFAYGREGRASFCCFNRKVRDLLLANHFVTAEECTPIVTLDTPPAGAELLDESGIPLPRYNLWFTEEELREIKSRAATAWQAFAVTRKPERKANLETVLQQLRDAARSDPLSFHPGAEPTAMVNTGGSLLEELPTSWAEVLKAANGFSFETGDCFEVVPLESLADYHTDTQARAKSGDSRFPERLLHITHGFGGDFHSLDLGSMDSAGECRVIEFDHETLEPRREWPSIALFLQEALPQRDAEHS